MIDLLSKSHRLGLRYISSRTAHFRISASLTSQHATAHNTSYFPFGSVRMSRQRPGQYPQISSYVLGRALGTGRVICSLGCYPPGWVVRGRSSFVADTCSPSSKDIPRCTVVFCLLYSVVLQRTERKRKPLSTSMVGARVFGKCSTCPRPGQIDVCTSEPELL